MEPPRKSGRARKPSARALQANQADEPFRQTRQDATSSADGSVDGGRNVQRPKGERRATSAAGSKARVRPQTQEQEGAIEEGGGQIARRARSTRSRPTTANTSASAASSRSARRTATASSSPAKRHGPPPDMLMEDPQQWMTNGQDEGKHNGNMQVADERTLAGPSEQGGLSGQDMRLGSWYGGSDGWFNAEAGPSRPRPHSTSFPSFPSAQSYRQAHVSSTRRQHLDPSQDDYNRYDGGLPARLDLQPLHYAPPPTGTYAYQSSGHAYPRMSSRPSSPLPHRSDYSHEHSTSAPDPAYPPVFQSYRQHTQPYISYGGPIPQHFAAHELAYTSFDAPAESRSYASVDSYQTSRSHYEPIPHAPPIPRSYHPAVNSAALHSHPSEARYTGRPAPPDPSVFNAPYYGSRPKHTADSYPTISQPPTAPHQAATNMRFWHMDDAQAATSAPMRPAASEHRSGAAPVWGSTYTEYDSRQSSRMSIGNLVDSFTAPPLRFNRSPSPARSEEDHPDMPDSVLPAASTSLIGSPSTQHMNGSTPVGEQADGLDMLWAAAAMHDQPEPSALNKSLDEGQDLSPEDAHQDGLSADRSGAQHLLATHTAFADVGVQDQRPAKRQRSTKRSAAPAKIRVPPAPRQGTRTSKRLSAAHVEEPASSGLTSEAESGEVAEGGPEHTEVKQFSHLNQAELIRQDLNPVVQSTDSESRQGAGPVATSLAAVDDASLEQATPDQSHDVPLIPAPVQPETHGSQANKPAADATSSQNSPVPEAQDQMSLPTAQSSAESAAVSSLTKKTAGIAQTASADAQTSDSSHEPDPEVIAPVDIANTAKDAGRPRRSIARRNPTQSTLVPARERRATRASMKDLEDSPVSPSVPGAGQVGASPFDVLSETTKAEISHPAAETGKSAISLPDPHDSEMPLKEAHPPAEEEATIEAPPALQAVPVTLLDLPTGEPTHLTLRSVAGSVEPLLDAPVTSRTNERMQSENAKAPLDPPTVSSGPLSLLHDAHTEAATTSTTAVHAPLVNEADAESAPQLAVMPAEPSSAKRYRKRKQALGPRSPRPVRASRARPSLAQRSDAVQPEDASSPIKRDQRSRSSSMSSALTSIGQMSPISGRSPSPNLPENVLDTLEHNEDIDAAPATPIESIRSAGIPAPQLAGPLASLFHFEPVIEFFSMAGAPAVEKSQKYRKRKAIPVSAPSHRLQSLLTSTSKVPVGDAGRPKENGDRRPARVRRAAGGGTEGVRDLEEMIIDWLDRYGETEQALPVDLKMTFSYTASENRIDPPVPFVPATVPAAEIIDIPEFMLYDEAADDRWQATQEIEIQRWTGARDQGIRTHKRGRLGELPLDPAPDEHYLALHRKFEVQERKQRARDKETLQHERYKISTRVDLLKGMSEASWETVLVAVLSRPAPGQVQETHWERGKRAVIRRGAQWLQEILVKEGEELLDRYDQQLPAEPRKPKADSRTPTPLLARDTESPEPSASPQLPDEYVAPSNGRHRRKRDAASTSPALAPRRGRPSYAADLLERRDSLSKRARDSSIATPRKKQAAGGKPKLPPIATSAQSTGLIRTLSRRSRLAEEATAEDTGIETEADQAEGPVHTRSNIRRSRRRDAEIVEGNAPEQIEEPQLGESDDLISLPLIVPVPVVKIGRRSVGHLDAGMADRPYETAAQALVGEGRPVTPVPSGRGTPRIVLRFGSSPKIASPAPAPMISPQREVHHVDERPLSRLHTQVVTEEDRGAAPTRKEGAINYRTRMTTRSTSPQKPSVQHGDELQSEIGGRMARRSGNGGVETDGDSDQSKEALEVEAVL